MNPAIIELTAPDISCAKCRTNIEGDLASEPGVGASGRHLPRPPSTPGVTHRVRQPCLPGAGTYERAGPERALP